MRARLRLLLAILVLALVPMVASATMPAAPMALAADGDSCGHPCGSPPHGHAHAACPLSCALHMAMPPLSSASAVVPPAVRDSHPPVCHDVSNSSARWPPPLRPPRV